MISIILPTYKRMEPLLQTLESLNQQECKDFEAVVINDDPEVKLTLDISRYQYPIKVLNNEKNQGVGNARNIGIEVASYEWIAFLDDDDFYREDKITILLQVIRDNPDIDLIYHPIYYDFIKENKAYVTAPLPAGEVTFSKILISNVVGGTPCWVMRKSACRKFGLFDSSMIALEDYELLIRWIKNGAKLYYIDQPLSHCIALTKSIGLSKDMSKALNAFARLEEIYGEDYANQTKEEQNARKTAMYSLLGFTYVINLDRRLVKYYLKAFWCSKHPKFLAGALLGFIHPQKLIALRADRSKRKYKR